MENGASPRVRGNPEPALPRPRRRRCIPARAGEPRATSPRPGRTRVHPRACGGTAAQGLVSVPRQGASPRVRGNRLQDFWRGISGRCIPARAGEPPGRGSPGRRRRVHPRACGGTSAGRPAATTPMGASPRVRGNRFRRGAGAPRRGCIPARAGEPGSPRVRSASRRVHPRACGGTWFRVTVACGLRGASPRVRGNRLAGVAVGPPDGCIPARAGEPPQLGHQHLVPRVHPRACGGTTSWRVSVCGTLGASPRVRGNPGRPVGRGRAGGCIPARAGEPTAASDQDALNQVHPRACGGTTSIKTFNATRTGASPRVRGNRLRLRPRLVQGRCIPARAGEPGASQHEDDQSSVHPRACGGTPRSRRAPLRRAGASPRVRGNPGVVTALVDGGGCIPARAGEPTYRRSHCPASRVHPRACGGTAVQLGLLLLASGASPRVRGNLGASPPTSRALRCIPARAGEPSTTWTVTSMRRVHPRACGGTKTVSPTAVSATGASPRVRGNPGQPRPAAAGRGCIPARAGEPHAGPAARRRRAVHPRACGGTGVWARVGIGAEGASPRVRGNRCRAWRSRTRQRCIPARAGEPHPSRSRCPPPGVHPRACGGTAAGQSTGSHSTGASPRVRGNRGDGARSRRVLRCIPARAGEPPARKRRAALEEVHPRACGGTYLAWCVSPSAPGASPRVRGNREHDARAPHVGRCIPARAGEPRSSYPPPRTPAVHPRACGGTGRAAPGPEGNGGASPRVRGNPSCSGP